jgi:hypothetical protein
MNMAFKMVDRVFIVAHGAEDPSDEEWSGYLGAVEHHGIDRTMQLVFTEGRGPTPSLTAGLNDLLAGRTMPVAVFSASAGVRARVTAMSWFNRKFKAFAPLR